jgi:diguanylate cyclase (GGDEF)-like protein
MTAKIQPSPTQPQTRRELEAWIRRDLHLPAADEASLLANIDALMARHERLWQESKNGAIQTLSATFADRLALAKRELTAKDATFRSISLYFEQLVADLTDRAHRDPKTKLMNFDRFSEQLESFLATEQRGTWCAVGLVDITGFKWYNDTLGHAAGDRIIERVAHLLREEVRSDDLIAHDGLSEPGQDLHARFGGDEFCFLIPDLDEHQQGYAIAERFREAVERFAWVTEDERLESRSVRVDVGVVCLRLGQLADRQLNARATAAELIRRADQLMYRAKGDRATHIYMGRVSVEGGQLVELSDPAATHL